MQGHQLQTALHKLESDITCCVSKACLASCNFEWLSVDFGVHEIHREIPLEILFAGQECKTKRSKLGWYLIAWGFLFGFFICFFVVFFLLWTTSKIIFVSSYCLAYTISFCVFFLFGILSRIRYQQNQLNNLVQAIMEHKQYYSKAGNQKNQNDALFDNKPCVWHCNLKGNKSVKMLLHFISTE